MEKLVSESVHEFRERKTLNEGIFQKIGSAIKGLFEKIGKFFFVVKDGQVEPLIPPVNVGIMTKENLISPVVSYVSSPEDISLEPGVSSENAQKLMAMYKAKEKEVANESLDEALVPLEHPDTDVVNVSKDELFEEIEMALDDPEQKPLMIWGAPGIGKTEIVGQVLKANGSGRLIDVQTAKMAPDDWALPAIAQIPVGSGGSIGLGQSREAKENPSGATEPAAIDLPKSWLPVYKPSGDPATDAKWHEALGEGILFLDELSRASESVQNTCLKLVGERVIGDAKLGDGWVIISAGNRGIDDPETLPTWSTALGNRFEQINYVPDYDGWKEWAIDKVNPLILDFLEFNRESFYTLDDGGEQAVYASPRSWAAASNAIKKAEALAKKKGRPLRPSDVKRAVGKSVGVTIATEVETFARLLETFSKEDIRKILEDPDKAPLPKKAGSGYNQAEANAILSLVISTTRDREVTAAEAENFAKYLVRLDNGSLATRAYQYLYQVHPEMNKELGEIEGKDKFKKSYDIFKEKYGELF